MKTATLTALATAGATWAAMALQPGDGLHGFTVRSVVALPEVHGRLVSMVYGKTGTELVWLDRADDNKTFAIGFRTFPADDTGVAHIIEHSVLCGSGKYPVKEPFVDLLKSSFATFLNAWTSSDATMYPVCSRNPTDFLNLVDVYLDAVLHPLSVKTPLAFRQEGWHYEFKEDSLVRNGVVYSEMKGAFANPERVLYHELNRLLYPDTCYRFVSGGDPASIPNLTFEGYASFYRRYYHPSNARIFLDGRVDLEATLAKIDGFLSPYSRQEMDVAVPFQKPVSADRTIPYEVDAASAGANRHLLAEGWVCGRFDEREKYLALDVLTSALCDSNESPLKKALLEKGLCEDVSLGVESAAQISVRLTVKNVKAGNVAAVRNTVRETLSSLAAKGLDRARLAALVDNAEFHDREKDYGGFPRGLAFFSDAFDVWLYGGDPADAFRNGSRFATLRKWIAEGAFERLLREALVDNPHHVFLTMEPDPKLGAKRAADDRAKLDALRKGWTKDECDRVKRDAEALLKHQSEPDRPEDMAKLPVLALKDIPLVGPETPCTVVPTPDGGPLVRPEVSANGVTHAELHFSLADLTDAELDDVPMLATVLGELATADYGPIALRNALEGRLGRFSTACGVYGRAGDRTAAFPYLTASVSALDARRGDILKLLPEVLCRTKFNDPKAVGKLVKQCRLARERTVQGLPGRVYPQRRVAAQISAAGAVEERFNGFTQLRRLQEVDAAFAKDGASYTARLAALAKRIFTRGRLTLVIPAGVPDEFAHSVYAAFPEGRPGPAVARAPFPPACEGFAIPARIGFAARASYVGPDFHTGQAKVAARILTLDHLWDEIRVKGGAYGGNFRPTEVGSAAFLSWNDPQPARTLQVYADSGAALIRRAGDPAPLDRYIVSTVAATEPYLSARAEMVRAGDDFLSGRTNSDRRRLRAEMLSATREDVRKLGETLERIGREPGAVCVLAGKPLLDACSNRLDRVENVLK